MSTTATQVRERPILFSGEMVRAILAGRKTQTRRVVNPQPIAGPLPGGKYEASDPWVGDDGIWRFMRGVVSRGEDDIGRCPYGQPGGRLWVREAWAKAPKGTIYRADFDTRDGFGSEVVDLATGQTVPLRWRPSIHMPRALSRLTLEITEVRVERVQEITEEDATAEGWGGFLNSRFPGDDPACYGNGPRTWFRKLWDGLNGPRGYGWDANPWVWVVSFRRA